MSYIIGVDSGGTFTDTVVVDNKNHVTIGKAPSTPSDYSVGILDSVSNAALGMGINPTDLVRQTDAFVHGTTAPVNALITGRGAKVGLITTKGFENILLMDTSQKAAGLTEREIIHAVKLDRPKPIIPRSLIKGVTERVDYKGRVVVPLNIEETRQAIRELVNYGVEAIAVGFLWSFLTMKHELEVKRLIKEIAPQIFVTLSSEIAPRIGEYQRIVTACLNCLLGKVSSAYFRTLDEKLKQKGLGCPLLIMQSIGGVFTSEEANAKVVMTLGSGPVGGVIGARFLSQILGLHNIICTDVGGTSFDVGLIVNGEPQYEAEPIFNQYRTALPEVEVSSIGSGGGSIAWLEPATGALRVGPDSAGSDPGPVCYNKGGTEPTVTDACVILGYIDPDYFLGGKMKLNRDKALTAFKEKIADPLAMDVVTAASGVYKICASQMADLIRKMTVERGHDFRDFFILSYGGAGPLFASFFLKDLDVKGVVIPVLAPVFSAFGIAASDIIHFYSRSDPMIVPSDVHERLNLIYRELEKKALEDLEREGVPKQDITLVRSADMRYKRQWHEVSLPMPAGEYKKTDIENIVPRFESRYVELYGRGAGFQKAGVEMVTYSVHAIGRRAKPSLIKRKQSSSDATEAFKVSRPAFFEAYKGLVATNVYDAKKLQPGNVIPGHAIVEAEATTIVIFPGQTATVDEYSNIILHL